MNKIKVVTLSLLLVSLVGGCQAKSSAIPSVQEQMNGLADLIGSAAFLRDRCGVSDIPANKSLSMIAVMTGMEMGWDTREYYPDGKSDDMYNATLDQMGQKVEQSLMADNPDVAGTCQSLAGNQHIAGFVAQAKVRG